MTDISNTAYSTEEPSLFLCRQVGIAYPHYCNKWLHKNGNNEFSSCKKNFDWLDKDYVHFKASIL